MARVVIHNFAVSLDGYGTGEGQSLDSPFGHAGGRLMSWFMATRSFQSMHGGDGGTRGIDDAFASRWGDGIGAEIMGRRKFGPQQGPWDPDDDWTGWWGDEPPFHTPVIVLTHHPRPDLVVGETTFRFVDASPAEALAVATEAAGGGDVRIGGGVETVREFLRADLVDQANFVIVPIVLGRGEHLWSGLEGLEERFDIESTASPSGVIHLTFTRKPR